MSAIRKKPFIEKMLAKMNTSEKESLKTILNTASSNSKASFNNFPSKGITAVYFQLNESMLKTGIMVYTDDHTSETGDIQCVLLTYNNTQNIIIYKINKSNNTYEKIAEECTIEELRRALDDSLENDVMSIDTDKDVAFSGGISVEKSAEIGGDLNVVGKIKQNNVVIPLTVSNLTLTATTGGYISTEEFTDLCEVVLKVDTSTPQEDADPIISHSGASFIVQPYSEASYLIPFNLLINSEVVNAYAYIGENDKIFIAVPDTITITNISAKYKVIK